MALKTLIQIRRGLESSIGALAIGELGYCTDSGKLYIGSAAGNVLLVAAQSTGDMLKSIYDTNNNGKVDFAQQADSVAWAGVAGKPVVFLRRRIHMIICPKAPNLESTEGGVEDELRQLFIQRIAIFRR